MFSSFTKQVGAALQKKKNKKEKEVKESIQRRRESESIRFSMPLGPSEFEEDFPLKMRLARLIDASHTPGPLLLIHLID